MLADRTLYLDRSRTRLVGETDPDVAWLLVWKGREIPAEDVKRLGLVLWSDGRVMQGPEPMDPPAVMPEPAAEMAPESPAAPAEPIMPPQSRRSRRKS